MAAIPEKWRSYWCGGERGLCACLGCVQIGNRAVIFAAVTGQQFFGDPECIKEWELQRANPSVYDDKKLSHEEWASWMARAYPPHVTGAS
jgi:hypothetical protein